MLLLGSRASGDVNESSSPLLAGPASGGVKCYLRTGGVLSPGNPLGVSSVEGTGCSDGASAAPRQGTARDRDAITIQRLPLLRLPLFPSILIF